MHLLHRPAIFGRSSRQVRTRQERQQQVQSPADPADLRAAKTNNCSRRMRPEQLAGSNNKRRKFRGMNFFRPSETKVLLIPLNPRKILQGRSLQGSTFGDWKRL